MNRLVGGACMFAALAACGKSSSSSGASSAAKSKEAELELDALEKAEKVQFVEQTGFVEGHAGPTPPVPCCLQPGKRCTPNAAAWADDAVWGALDFSIDEPSDFQYSYQSDGKTMTATAIGDPGCTGNQVTFTLTGTSANGNPAFTLAKP